jgi:hypothetical protein
VTTPQDAHRGLGTVVPTEYTVSPLPLDHPDMEHAHHWTITVEWRGENTWAVKHFGYTLTRGGEWEYEPRPSAREDDYLDRCRFGLAEALDLARDALPSLKVNGRTYADWEASRGIH